MKSMDLFLIGGQSNAVQMRELGKRFADVVINNVLKV